MSILTYRNTQGGQSYTDVLSDLYPYAEYAAKKLNTNPLFVLSQWAGEIGKSFNKSSWLIKGNNIAGINVTANNTPLKEYGTTKYPTAFPDIQTAVDYWLNNILNYKGTSTYNSKGLLSAGQDINKYSYAMGAGGYAAVGTTAYMNLIKANFSEISKLVKSGEIKTKNELVGFYSPTTFDLKTAYNRTNFVDTQSSEKDKNPLTYMMEEQGGNYSSSIKKATDDFFDTWGALVKNSLNSVMKITILLFIIYIIFQAIINYLKNE